jgi:hypothetical protein
MGDNETQFAEVQYYFFLKRKETRHALALVHMYSEPDEDLLQASYTTLKVCKFLKEDGLRVIDAKWISDVVGMVPFTQRPAEEQLDEEEYFVVEKMSLGRQELILALNDDDEAVELM